MSVVKQGTLLLLLLLLQLGVISTNADHDDCHRLNTKLSATDLHKILGDWVLVWSVTDHQEGWDLLPNITSSHVEFRLLPDNHTYVLNERNMYIDKLCANYIVNMSTEGSDDHMLHSHGATVERNGIVELYNESGHVDLYESCPDCLVMVYIGPKGRYLLSYRRDGHHRDAEILNTAHDNHKKQAECLGFPHDKPFSYDGVADFCHKKSSPDVEVDHHDKAEQHEKVEPTVKAAES